MASYTIEDIELIRKKSGISYQEAVALLDYHNGNVARALIDLERNGRIKNDAAQKTTAKDAGHQGKNGLTNFFSKLYQFRLKVKKENIIIANISLLFALLALLVSPHLVLIAAIAILVLGYKVSFNKKDADFAAANLEKMVRNAADNVKSTVSDFAKGFEDNSNDKAAATNKAAQEMNEAAEEIKNGAKEIERSFYQSNPAATTYHTAYTGSAPTIQVPVQVETQEGSVNVQDDSEGFTNATIE
ncbi:MAG: hypothetical protein IJX84_04500 [Clostridia bacterium]|nr:hypothetical protein [Clostridia bacterium]